MKRVEEVRNNLQIKNVSEFCRIIGFKNRFYYSELLDSDKPFPNKYLINLYEKLDVNLNWLLSGEGKMYIWQYFSEIEIMTHRYKQIHGDDWKRIWDNRPLEDLSLEELGEYFLKLLESSPYEQKVRITGQLIKSTAFISLSHIPTIIHFTISPMWTHSMVEMEIIYKLLNTILSYSVSCNTLLKELLKKDLGLIMDMALKSPEKNPEICEFLESGHKVDSKNTDETRSDIKNVVSSKKREKNRSKEKS